MVYPGTTNVVFNVAVGGASASTEVETVGDPTTTTDNTFLVSAGRCYCKRNR